MVQLGFPFDSDRPGAGPAPARVALRFIRITWSESNDRRFVDRSFASWSFADDVIRALARSAPKGGGYDKTGFVIEWADGETYEGRIDVIRDMEAEAAPLAEHVRRSLSFACGRWRPSRWTEEDHAAMLADTERRHPGNQATAAKLLDGYDIGAGEGAP